MTTIAWDGTTLAADTRCDTSAGKANCSKLYRLKDGGLFGAAGHYDTLIEQYVKWLNTERKELPEFQKSDDHIVGLEVTPNGMVYLHERYGASPIVVNHMAVGSGAKYARGAMQFGANAVQAIQCTSELDCFTGKETDVLTLTNT